jgi:hypothetical protein
MEQFRNKPEGFKEVRKLILIRTIPITLIGMGTGLAVNGSAVQNGIAFFLTLFILLLISLSIGLYIGIKRQKELFESYILSIDEVSITREQKNTPMIKLLKEEIKEIIKVKNGNFEIKGTKAGDLITVYAQIENYENLERKLNQIKSITIKSSHFFNEKLRTPAIAIFASLLMAIVYMASNKIIVGISGIVLTGSLIWSFFKTQRSKNIDIKTKQGSYLLIFVLFSIIAATIFKIMK